MIKQMKYNYEISGNTVTAYASYAGKRIQAKAICADCDKFDANIGMQVAAKRLDIKIFKKRLQRADRMYNEAMIRFMLASADFEDRGIHYREVMETLDRLESEYDELIASV